MSRFLRYTANRANRRYDYSTAETESLPAGRARKRRSNRMVETITLKPVGVVKSPFSEIGDRDWRRVVAEIHIDPALTPGLTGIEEYSHLVIIYYLHKSKFDPAVDMIRHPMDRADLPARGVFALRTNYRPAPLALTTVELLQVAGNVLTVRGLDALDGSPVLDVKPFLPDRDLAENATLPAWMERALREPAPGDATDG